MAELSRVWLGVDAVEAPGVLAPPAVSSRPTAAAGGRVRARPVSPSVRCAVPPDCAARAVESCAASAPEGAYGGDAPRRAALSAGPRYRSMGQARGPWSPLLLVLAALSGKPEPRIGCASALSFEEIGASAQQPGLQIQDPRFCLDVPSVERTRYGGVSV